MTRPDFPNGKFRVFLRWSLWSGVRPFPAGNSNFPNFPAISGGGGGYPPLLLLRCTAILTLPCPPPPHTPHGAMACNRHGTACGTSNSGYRGGPERASERACLALLGARSDPPSLRSHKQCHAGHRGITDGECDPTVGMCTANLQRATPLRRTATCTVTLCR